MGPVHSDTMREPKVDKRATIPVVEEVTVVGPKGSVRVLARIDTGAARTTLDTDLAARAGLGPVLDRVRIRASAASKLEVRDGGHAKVLILGQDFEISAEVTTATAMQDHINCGMANPCETRVGAGSAVGGG